MASYMITLRQQDGGDDPAVTPRYLQLGDPGQDPTELSQQRWTAAVISEFPPGPPTPGAPSPDATPVTTRSGDIIFFVHGFNVDFDSAVAAHRKYAGKLAEQGFTGLFISFDWPSKGATFAYLSDRDHARRAASSLVTSGISLLRDAQVAGCTISLHVMAHSMGCFVTQQAFVWSYQDVPPDWRVGQIVLVAADVDWTVFSADTPTAKAFGAHSARLTAYCDKYDKSLAISNAKRLELAPRMGRVGLPDDSPELMCEVDCSDLFDAVDPGLLLRLDPVKTHCFYFDQDVFWQDVVLTLAGGIDRALIPTRAQPPKGPNRFDLDTAAMADADYRLALARASQSPSFG
jgi:hypothetical protein